MLANKNMKQNEPEQTMQIIMLQL